MKNLFQSEIKRLETKLCTEYTNYILCLFSPLRKNYISLWALKMVRYGVIN